MRTLSLRYHIAVWPVLGLNKEVIWMTVAIKIRQHPRRSSRAKEWARTTWPTTHVIVKIPYRCLLRAGIVKHVIWHDHRVKVGHSRQRSSQPQAVGPDALADVNVVVNIPNRCLPCAGVEQQVIRMAVAIKIRHTLPGLQPTGEASDRKRRPMMNVVVQIPDRCLARAGVVKQIIRLARRC